MLAILGTWFCDTYFIHTAVHIIPRNISSYKTETLSTHSASPYPPTPISRDHLSCEFAHVVPLTYLESGSMSFETDLARLQGSSMS